MLQVLNFIPNVFSGVADGILRRSPGLFCSKLGNPGLHGPHMVMLEQVWLSAPLKESLNSEMHQSNIVSVMLTCPHTFGHTVYLQFTAFSGV